VIVRPRRWDVVERFSVRRYGDRARDQPYIGDDPAGGTSRSDFVDATFIACVGTREKEICSVVIDARVRAG
jgi:hypothetical protein